jgi:transcriptional regulator with XRE-family HTH domain
MAGQKRSSRHSISASNRFIISFFQDEIFHIEIQFAGDELHGSRRRKRAPGFDSTYRRRNPVDHLREFGLTPAACQARSLYLLNVIAHASQYKLILIAVNKNCDFYFSDPGIGLSSDSMNNIRDRLRLLRTSQGLTVEKAAELSGYSAPQIRKIEGGHSPNLICLNALLEAYGSTLQEFFESAERPANPEDREVFERLQFILDEARREDAGQAEKDLAQCLLGIIDVFYRDGIRQAGKITRRKSGGGGAEAVKPQTQKKIHGRFKGPTTAGKFPD